MHLRQFGQLHGDLVIDRTSGDLALGIGFPGGQAGQQFHRLVDAADCPDPEASFPCRRDDFLAQHQVADIGGGNQHALFAGQAARGTDVEETLDLLVDAADRLHHAELIHRSGHRERLADRDAGQGGEQGGQFGQRGAVAFDAAV